MKELFDKSLRMIKYCKIKSVDQYNELLQHFVILNVISLKYITGMNFKEIIKLAKEVN